MKIRDGFCMDRIFFKTRVVHMHMGWRSVGWFRGG